MKFLKDWGWLILVGIFCLLLVVETVDIIHNPKEVRVAMMHDHLRVYDAAMKVGDMKVACQTASIMSRYAINSGDAEFAKPYYKMKEEACK